jgi:hypothetical protein
MTHALLLSLVLAGSPAVPSPVSTAAATPAASAKELARDGFALALARFRAGTGAAEEVCLWAKRLRDAAPHAEADDKAYLERLNLLLSVAQKRVESGLASPLESLTIQFLIAEAASDHSSR